MPAMLRKLFSGKSMHQCFESMYVLLHHTGCLAFKLENGDRLYYTQWSCVYVYVVRFLLLAGFLGGFALKVNDRESYNAMIGELTPLIKFVLTIECSLTAFTYLEVSFMFDFSRSKHLKNSLRLQQIDNELKKEFPGVNWNYHKSSRKYNIMVIVIYIYFIVISFSYVFSMAKCRCGYFSSFLISFCYACLTGSPGLATFLYVGAMDMVRLRFRLLHKSAVMHFSQGDASSVKGKHSLRVLKRLEFYFQEYCYMIPKLNAVYSNLCASGLFHDFAILTNVGYLLCSKALEAKTFWYEYLFIVLFVSPRIYKLIITNIYGFLAEKEKNKFIQQFMRAEKCFPKSPYVQREMQSFHHWCIHNDYHFMVGKTLRCNIVLIFVVINSIINYILILIQLQYQQNVITNSFHGDFSEDVELIYT